MKLRDLIKVTPIWMNLCVKDRHEKVLVIKGREEYQKYLKPEILDSEVAEIEIRQDPLFNQSEKSKNTLDVKIKTKEEKELQQDNKPDNTKNKDRDVYKYYFSDERHCSHYDEGADTIEECFKKAQEIYEDADRIYIARSKKYEPIINVGDVFNDLYTEAVQSAGEGAGGWLENVTNKQEEKLEQEINKVFRKWLYETGNNPEFYVLTDVKDYPIIKTVDKE